MFFVCVSSPCLSNALGVAQNDRCLFIQWVVLQERNAKVWGFTAFTVRKSKADLCPGGKLPYLSRLLVANTILRNGLENSHGLTFLTYPVKKKKKKFRNANSP